MGTLLAIVLSATVPADPIQQTEIDQQNRNFQRWWATDLEWKLEALPIKGAVKKHRLPYSGHIYPDSVGGTSRIMWKYDQAFHDGKNLAAAFEHHDSTRAQEVTYERRGLFGLQSAQVMRTPHWHGHCNGWSAAAMRHAEPQRSVRRNGVVFTPADIKGLLAELYIYSENVFLGGVDYTVNPGTFHVIIANWIGRGKHPVGMEATPGDEKWNYPIFAYNSKFALRGDHAVVKMNIAYAGDTDGEYNRSRLIKQIKSFHYRLDLDEDGVITGGEYYRDSDQVDMLWVARQPQQGGTEGNKRGNPHLDVKQVLSIWRASVPKATRDRWLNIDPTEEDKVDDSAPEDPDSN